MLFGWFDKKKSNESPEKKTAEVVSPVTPTIDGSLVIDSSQLSGYYGISFDLDSTISDEIQMLSRYRDVALYPDCDAAIEQIVNESIVVDDENTPVEINLEKLPKGYETIKNKIKEEFDNVLKLYDFNDNCHDMFKRWYIDGRLFYYIDVDETAPKNGIRELRYIDPRKIKKITEIKKITKDGVDLVSNVETYYLFNDAGLNGAQKGLKINPNAIVDVPSGQVDSTTGTIVSYLYKAIKPINQLKMMEDALVIYRITRAPERRIFYVDVANMPPAKAEQYVQNIMNKFRNKVQYDATTGEVRNNRNYMSLSEDFWLPRREGGRSTEIQTLPGGQNLSDIADIEYFQKKLYQAMEVPRQRLQSETNFQLGRSTEISREEVIFSSFVKRLRNKFNVLFKDPLRIQLIAKNIIKEEEWEEIKNLILFDYHQNNYFEELKENEILTERLNQLQIIDAFRGSYFSREWIALNILKLSEDDWQKMKEEMDAEEESGNEGAESGEGGGDNFGGDMGGGDDFNPLSAENNASGEDMSAEGEDMSAEGEEGGEGDMGGEEPGSATTGEEPTNDQAITTGDETGV